MFTTPEFTWQALIHRRRRRRRRHLKTIFTK
jgi:hypothetical protein